MQIRQVLNIAGWIAFSCLATAYASELPDAPQAQTSAPPLDLGKSGVPPARTVQVEHYAKYINPDEIADPLGTKDKFGVVLREQIVPYALASTVLSAGISHGLQNNPKYGSDAAGFGERVGAAYLEQTSQAFLSDGVFASLFHEDPRYYSLNSGTLVHRGIYAASRVLITRNDAGRNTINFSELLGYAGAAALTTTYYPHASASAADAASGFATSLGGAALGFVVHEFAPNPLRFILHGRHKGNSPQTP